MNAENQQAGIPMNGHRSGSAKVLMYHRIVDGEAGSSESPWAVTSERLRSHLELLERWDYTAITFEDMLLCHLGELNLPKKPIILTFDDGYQDFYDVAYPMLREFGMSAVVFLVRSPNVRSNVWDIKDKGVGGRLMTDDQVLEVSEAGFEVGSHTLSHRDLTKITREEAWEEISRSRMNLEILLNKPVTSFCYPYGAVNGEVKQMVNNAGYRFACGVWSGPAVLEKDPLEIRRVSVHEHHTPMNLMLRLTGAYQYYRWAWWRFFKPQAA